MRRIIAVVLFLAMHGAHGQTVDLQILVKDSTGAGCLVSIEGVDEYGGIDALISASLDRVASEVTQVTLSTCSGDTFGPPVSIGGGQPLGDNVGINGADVVELAVDRIRLPTGPVLQIAAVATNGSGADGTASGLFGREPVVVPSLGSVSLLLLAFAVAGIAFFALRRQRLLTSVLLCGVVLTAVAGAAFIADGQIDDWAGVPPLVTDPAGDATAGQSATDIVAVFAAQPDQPGNGASETVYFRVDFTDLLIDNSPPEITSDGGGATATVDAPENQTSVTTVTATDADVPAQALTFSISGGADQALFSIDPTSGVLTFNSAPDFEAPGDANTDNAYEVQVTVTDDGTPSLSDVQDITIAVTDANEAPVITSDGGGATATVDAPENQTSVTTVTATDADVPAQALTFSISGGADQALFSIDPTSGVLTFNSAPDFEAPGDANTDNDYEVQVTATDDGTPSLSDVQDLAITLTDVDEVPVPVQVDLGSIPEDGNILVTETTLAAGITGLDAGETVSVSNFVLTSGEGTVTNNPDGSWSFSPTADWSGNPSFNYDYAVGTDVGANTAILSVTAEADAPILVLDSSPVSAQSGRPKAALPVPTGLFGSAYSGLISTDRNAANVEAVVDPVAADESARTVDGFGTPKVQFSASVQTDGSTIRLNATDIFSITGLIYLEAGRSYQFQGYRDDILRMELGGETLISTTGDSWGNYGPDAPQIRFQVRLDGESFTPTENGFYTVEVYAANFSGPGQVSVNLIVDGQDPRELNAQNFNIYSSVEDLVSVNGQFGAFVPGGENPDGGYFPLVLNSGVEGNNIEISGIASDPADLDGSESIVDLIIEDIPVGAVLTDGVNAFSASAGNTATSILGWAHENIQILPPSGFTGTFDLVVTAVAEESGNGDQASTSRNLSIAVDGLGDLISSIDTDLIGSDDATYGTPQEDNITTGPSDDIVVAGAGDDTVDTQAGSDVIDGGPGNDTLTGAGEDDVIAGGPGDDQFIAGAGNDILFAEFGNDRMQGDAGQDAFVWRDYEAGEQDTIAGFVLGAGNDVIDLSEILVGESADAAILDDYLDFSLNGADTLVAVDADGDGSGADLSIVLEGIDLTVLGNDELILQDLLTNGNLVTD